MMSAILEIVPPTKGSLPTCTPHLMPFHVKYSGPAPISTYFRPKPVPAPSFGKSTTTDTIAINSEATPQSTTTEVTSQNTEIVVEDGGGVSKTQDVEMSDRETPTLQAPAGDRFVAAFRGRAIHGTQVELPEGYTGIVLSASKDGKEKESSAAPKSQGTYSLPPKSTRRAARNSRRAIDVDGDEIEAAEDEDTITMADEDDRPTRTLNLTSKFSSFVIWNPDIPVDEGKDEYLRSLSEWTQLTAEVHRYDY